MSSEKLIHVSGFDLPRTSSLLPSAHKPVVVPTDGVSAKPVQAAPSSSPVPPPPRVDDTDANAIVAYREWMDAYFYPRIIKKQRAKYDVRIEARSIGGVPTEVIFPSAGVSQRNCKRVLINLHAGGFTFGGGMCSQLESIPVVGEGAIEVVAVDYRLAPEHRHPAAADDVLAVYKALLADHGADEIGIYGYSAGALLASQTIARIQAEGLPVPGALALLFGGASFWGEGDSSYWGPAISGRTMPGWREHLYFRGVEENDPAAFPLVSSEILAKFPSTLLVSGSRDFALSSVAYTHSRLVKLDVPAQLHVWEGVGHAFSHDFRLSQSAELFATLIRFFDQNLACR